MRYEFHPEALIEYEEAARYYAGSVRKVWNFGLDHRFGHGSGQGPGISG